MKLFLILCSMVSFSSFAHAQNPTTGLPDAVAKLHIQSYDIPYANGGCIQHMGGTFQSYPLANNATFYLVPCRGIANPTQAKVMRGYISYSMQNGMLMAANVNVMTEGWGWTNITRTDDLFNPSFDPKTGILSTNMLLRSTGDCGYTATTLVYSNPDAVGATDLTFTAKTDCDGKTDEPWTVLFPKSNP
jgi:hypothetical protein